MKTIFLVVGAALMLYALKQKGLAPSGSAGTTSGMVANMGSGNAPYSLLGGSSGGASGSSCDDGCGNSSNTDARIGAQPAMYSPDAVTRSPVERHEYDSINPFSMSGY